MHADPGLDVVVAVAIGGDLERAAVVAHGVVVADGARLVAAEDVLDCARVAGTKALSGCSGGFAKRALWSGRSTSAMNRFASSTVVIPASLSSLTKRSWRVAKARSERPLASGE